MTPNCNPISSIFDSRECYGFETAIRVVSILESAEINVRTHPLGFLQAIVIEGAREFRINFWGTSLGKPKTPNWPVHNHRFSFKSKIIFGELEETRYSVAECSDGIFALYAVSYNANGSTLKKIGGNNVSLTTAVINKYPSGVVYGCDSNVLHSAEASTGLTVSIMEIGKFNKSAPVVIGEPAYNAPVFQYEPHSVPLSSLRAEIVACHRSSSN